VAMAAIGLALGWRDGLPLDRLAVAALRWWRHPRRLVVAPEGIGPTPAWARPAGPPVAPLAGPIHGLDPTGVIDLGGLGWALVCQATPINLSLRTPAEQQQLLASDRANLRPLTNPLRTQAAALPHPRLEQAALAHARWLEALAGDRDVRRRQLLVVFHQPPAPARRPRCCTGGPSRPPGSWPPPG